MTRERLEGMRDRMIPWITHKVKGISLLNYSESDREKVREDLEELFDLAIKALEQEPTTKNDLEVDCISRADAIRVASGYCHPSNVAKELAKLPSVTPQEPILDKIRAEIDELYSYVEFDEDLKTSFNMVRLEEVQRVINKYKAESEGKE